MNGVTNLSGSSMYQGWRSPAILTAVIVLSTLGLFWQTAHSMVDIWWRSETFAHGFLILPISFWLIWSKRKTLATLQPMPNLWGLIPLFGLVLLWLVSNLVDILVIQQFALVAILVVTIWTLLGSKVTWAMAFPLGFLFFAVPVGEALIPPLMEFTADFTVMALQLTGIPVYREGMFFEIPSGHWSVVEGCSGLRYLIASITLGFLYAYLTYYTLWRRLLFIVLAIIVPIIANGARAYMIVMIAHLSDMKLALGVDHYIYGWVFFGIVMLLLFWIGNFWREDKDPAAISAPRISASAVASQNKNILLIALGCLALISIAPFAAYLYQRGAPEATTVTLKAPEPAAAWQLGLTPAWDWKPRYLGMSAELQQTYVRGNQPASIYLAYYRNQHQDAELVNSQNVMIPQKDARWSNIGEKNIVISLAGQPVEIRQTQLRSAGENLLIWDWYWLDGTYTSNPYIAKLVEAKGKLFGRQRNAASIIIATRYDERIQPAAAVLQEMVTAMLPAIEASLQQASKQ